MSSMIRMKMAHDEYISFLEESEAYEVKLATAKFEFTMLGFRVRTGGLRFGC